MTELNTPKNKLEKHAINVHKFGGSSLANAQCILRAVDIIRQNCQLNDIIVVSANGKTTDCLFTLLVLAQSKDFTKALVDLEHQQTDLINELLNEKNAKQLTHSLSADIKQLSQWLSSNLIQHRNDILAYGELWSARYYPLCLMKKFALVVLLMPEIFSLLIMNKSARSITP